MLTSSSTFQNTLFMKINRLKKLDFGRQKISLHKYHHSSNDHDFISGILPLLLFAIAAS